MTVKETLKPCPFCGGVARLQESGTIYQEYTIPNANNRREFWTVTCTECDVITPRFTDEITRNADGVFLTHDGVANAVSVWNKRTLTD